MNPQPLHEALDILDRCDSNHHTRLVRMKILEYLSSLEGTKLSQKGEITEIVTI